MGLPIATAIQRTVVLTVPSHSTGIGSFSFDMPRVPVLDACACCGGSERMTTRELSLTVPGYKGTAAVVPYAMCGSCADVAWFNVWIRRLLMAICALAGLGIAWRLGESNWLGLALVLGPAILVGLPVGSRLRRKCPVPGAAGHRCDDAVSGFASESGSAGAFGKAISSGALRIDLHFADTRYAAAFAAAMREQSKREPVIVELV